jgi:lincosamide nucleotidyltransferase
MELPQTKLIELVSSKCADDNRIEAALTYGSFTKGEGDEYSDIEFWLFFDDKKLNNIDQEQWINDIAPVYWSVINESGARVAFFKDHLIRGEFHFAPVSAVRQVKNWPAVEPRRAARMVLVDHTNTLQKLIEAGPPVVPSSPDDIEQLCGQYLNWHLFGLNVLKRGDLAQAHMILGIVQGYLIWMVRLNENATKHWQTQSKSLEQDISAESYKAFIATTARCNQSELPGAYDNAWAWSSQLINKLERRFKFSIPEELKQAISKYREAA